MNYKLSGTVRHEGQAYRVGDESLLLEKLSEKQKANFVKRELLVPVLAEGAPLEQNNTAAINDDLRAENEKLRARVRELTTPPKK